MRLSKVVLPAPRKPDRRVTFMILVAGRMNSDEYTVCHRNSYSYSKIEAK